MIYTLEKFRKIVDALNQIDTDKKDCTITMKEYSAISDSKIKETVTGDTNISSWNQFKEKLKDYLRGWGFDWNSLQGQGGPISLAKIILPREIGYEVAKSNFTLVKDGDFLELLRKELNSLFELITIEKLDYGSARNGFIEYKHKNMSYKFKRGRSSTAFYQSITEFVYGSDEKIQDEVKLGELIFSKLKEKMNIELDHTQVNRAGGKFQNIDFVGYRIENDLTSDKIIIYSFELKASNKITAISESINQATNYTAVSNYSYIIIPMFDEGLFFDESRFKTYVQQCSTNNIGIITIIFNEQTHEPESVYEVLPATYVDVLDKSTIIKFIKDRDYEICPLCKRIVSKEDRRGCDWLVSVGVSDKSTEDICMKKLMERRMANSES